MHFLLDYNRWLSGWSWLWNGLWLRWFFLWWRWNCFFSLLLLAFLSLRIIFLPHFLNLIVPHGLSLDINDVLIDGLLGWLHIGNTSFYLHKALWTRWHHLIHLFEHWVDLHLSGFDDLVSYSFLHQIDFTLPDDLHQLVLQWNRQFLSSIPGLLLLSCSFQVLYTFAATALHHCSLIRHHRLLFDGRIDQERIILV